MQIKFSTTKLQKAMAQSGISQSDLAKLLNFERAYVSMIMTGKSPISDEVQRRLNIIFQEFTNEEMILEAVRELKTILEEGNENG